MEKMKKSKPLIVFVSGTPGSGKTTLARRLAEHMRLLHVPRDEFFWAMTYTLGEHINRRQVGIPAYYDALVYLAEHRISLVTDGTIYKGISEEDIKKYLMPVSHLVNVHCYAKNERERFYKREIELRGENHPWLDDHMKYLETIYEQTVDPLDLGCTCIEVDTTDGYSPSIEKIANQIGDKNNALTEGNPYVGRKTKQDEEKS